MQCRQAGQALADKVDKILVKTVRGPAIEALQCIAAMCPSTLQTEKMCTPEAMGKSIPLVDQEEWAKYTALPRQLPPPSSTAARVHWWKVRLAEFPKLAPICIAYLLCPKAAGQCERTFSQMRHTVACYGLPFQSVAQ